MDNQILRAGVRDSAGPEVNPPSVAYLDTLSNSPQQAPNSGAPPGNPPLIAQPIANPTQPPPPQTPTPLAYVAPGAPTPPPNNNLVARLSPKVRIIGAVLLGSTIIVGLLAAFLVQRAHQAATTAPGAQNFNAIAVPLAGISGSGAITVGNRSLSINGQLQVNGSLIMTPAAQPSRPATGQLYYDQTSNHFSYYNGTIFVKLQTDHDIQGSTTNSTNNTTNNITNSPTTNVTNLSVTNNAGSVTTTNPIGGTKGTIAEFTSGQSLGDSILTDNTTFLGVKGGINISAASTTTDVSLYSAAAVPPHFDTNDTGGALELGVKFQVDVPGDVRAIRFYKGPSETGTFIGDLWTSTGTLLSEATFTVSGNGWQQVNFPSPIPVSPDTTYVAAYHYTPSNPAVPLGYPFDAGAFSAGNIDSGPLHGLASGIDGGNGVYKYAASPVLPNTTVNSTSYWVDVVFSGATYTSDSHIKINNAQISSSDLSNDSNLAKRGSSQVFSGNNIFRNANDSVDAFSMQRADATEMLSLDTQDNLIFVGPRNGGDPLLVLSNWITTNGDPPNAAEGAMYYQAVDKVFRCYHDGLWANCSDPQADHSYSLYDEFMTGETGSLAQNGPIGSLGWTAQNIGGTGTISFNPSTPTPIADRPGVLALQSPAVANQGSTLNLGSSSMLLENKTTVKTSVAIGAATNSVMRVGIHNETTTTTQPVSGVWWEANPSVGANWRYCYGDGTTATCAASGVAIAANTWVRLGISITSTGVGTSGAVFTINGTAQTVSNATIDITNRLEPAFTCYTTTGLAQNFYWDYFQLTGLTSTAR